MNQILTDRENRKHIIKSYIKSNNIIVALKVTLPGEDKRRIPCRIINNLLRERLLAYKILKKVQEIEDFDGYLTLYEVDSNEYQKIKKDMILIEETHPLGRYVDIDVYYQNEVPLSRTSFGKEMRKCYICDDFAVVCSRLKRHTTCDLIEKISNDTKNYLRQIYKTRITKALFYELDLHPKFGLVTKYSNGSHHDMDYQVMKKAIEAITPFLTEMVIIGAFNQIEDIREMIRHTGILAEKEMLKATNNINAYKGMIYIMGFACAAIGYLLANDGDFSDIITEISKNELSHFKNLNTINTFGEKMHKIYGITGARGVVANGLTIIKDCYQIIKDKNLDNSKLLHETLCYIVGNIDDTVLLKRAITIDKYNYYKNMISSINNFEIEYLNQITEKCIQDNISFGGASDILATAILYKFAKEGLNDE